MASPLPALGDMATHSARFAQLAKEFLSEVAAAEDAYARAMLRASGGLVSGLLSKPFEGASTQRQALVALTRMSAAFSAEAGAHATELLDQAVPRLAQIAAGHAKRAKVLGGSAATHARSNGVAEAALAAARADYAKVCGRAERAAAEGAIAPADPWVAELQLQACAQELEDVRGAARVEAQLAWDAAEASEAEASELVHKVMLDATQGMQRRLTAAADATSDAAAAARAVSGAADWGAFCQATRQKAPFLDGAAPAAPLLPNMAQVEKMGWLQRRVAGLLGSSWTEQQLVLTREGWLHAFTCLEQPVPLLSVALRGAALREHANGGGAISELEIICPASASAPASGGAGGGGGVDMTFAPRGWRMRVGGGGGGGGVRVQLRGHSPDELQAWTTYCLLLTAGCLPLPLLLVTRLLLVTSPISYRRGPLTTYSCHSHTSY